ncbi:OmpA family protein [Falsiroseomonas tokyonensis]|uniref:OmpA family protein n=1 Tax=Falsiroseomonas tokyonensis TaxID=430521 RepID=A0ABV7C595_9PROT|nr:OmpA family protein [Falsiroseomonas tokyonensis]MBU8541347.1 OmpA family protein [Falsiroseomonas tokyonensis]
MMRRTLLAALLLPLASPLVAPLAAGQPLPESPDGGWRLGFARGEATLDATARQTIASLAPHLAALDRGRITITAQASGPADDASIARRLSLARARAVRDALVEAGVEPTRIDLRSLGLLDPPADAADILPPGLPRNTR